MEEVKRFSEFLSLARAYKLAQTGFVWRLVYRTNLGGGRELDKRAGKDLVSAAQLMSAVFILLQGYHFNESDLEQVKQEIVDSLREANDILMDIAKETAERIGLLLVTSESPVPSKEIAISQAKRNFGL